MSDKITRKKTAYKDITVTAALTGAGVEVIPVPNRELDGKYPIGVLACSCELGAYLSTFFYATLNNIIVYSTQAGNAMYAVRYLYES